MVVVVVDYVVVDFVVVVDEVVAFGGLQLLPLLFLVVEMAMGL